MLQIFKGGGCGLFVYVSLFYTTKERDLSGEKCERPLFWLDENEEPRFELWWYLFESGGLSNESEKAKIKKIKGCETTFMGLWGCGGGAEEGVHSLGGLNL